MGDGVKAEEVDVKTGDLAITDAANRISFFTGRVVDGRVALKYAETVLKDPMLMIVVSSLQSLFSDLPFSLVIVENGKVGWIADARLRSVV